MRTRFLLFGILALACAGCARSYVMRLSNGTTITTVGKPKLKNSTYYFKGSKGEVQSVPQLRVMEIMPASMAREEKGRFNPSAR